MAKLIQLPEAAARLGITPEQLAEMRSRNEIFGYRDGSTWKFKESELERVAAQLLNEQDRESVMPPLSATSADSVDADLDELVDVKDMLDGDSASKKGEGPKPSAGKSDEEMGLADSLDEDDADAILVSEAELGTPTSGGSTIIGHDETDPLLSDVKISGASDVDHKATDDIELTEGSELKLAPGSDVLGDSPASGSPSSGGNETADLTGVAPEDSDATMLSDNALAGGSELLLDDGTDLKLDSSSGSEFGLVESSIDLDGSDVDVIGGSAAGSEDDEDVDILVGSSDVTLSSDSGINLSAPSESGILLEGFDSGASGLGSGLDALDLGDDDEILSLGDEAIDIDASTQLGSGDDFLLEPDDAFGDDAESGSQVIALDSEELDSDEVGVLAEHVVEGLEGDSEDAGSIDVTPTAAGATMVAAEPSEYSIWNVLGLMGCVAMLVLGGTMITDVIRSMWSWQEPYSLNSSLMDFVIGIFGGG